jgi:stage IV sporulation protein FB
MGWEDRPYYREGRNTGGNPLMWLLTGSVPLFTAFGIRVRAHASLILVCALLLLFGVGSGTAGYRIQAVTALFAVILLHEFGHCFAARWTGGTADEILMTPLGGLAMAMAVRRPWPTFVTVAGGPAVNVIICVLCGLGLYLAVGTWPLGPWQFERVVTNRIVGPGLLEFSGYLFWIYSISYGLLIFNMLPVFPLDGGQMLQSILWKPMGYYKSMLVTVNVGLVGSVLMAMVGIASFGSVFGGLLLLFIAINCFMNCYRTRQMLKAEGPWAFQDEDGPSYGPLTTMTETKTRAPGFLARRKAARAQQAEVSEQETIDRILAKVSAEGMHSLSRGEKKALQQATENQRRRDAERRKPRF